MHLVVFLAVNLRVRLGDPLDQTISSTSVCFACTSNVDVVFMCGFWDSSFKTFSTDSGINTRMILFYTTSFV